MNDDYSETGSSRFFVPTRKSLFGLWKSDRALIDELLRLVRTLINRADSTPQQLCDLAKLLFGLQYLPMPAKGVRAELLLGYRHGPQCDFLSITLNEEAFRLECQAWVIVTPSLGGEASGSTIFEAEVGGYRDAVRSTDVTQWLVEFAARASDPDAVLEVSDDGSHERVDWELPEEDYWTILRDDF